MGNVETVKSAYEAFGQGDIPGVLATFDPEVEWREAESNPYQPSGDPWIGPDAIVENLFMKIGDDWDGFAVTPHEFHDAGDVVVAEGRYTGTGKATGKDIDGQFCHIWTLSNGKITSFQQYVDTAQMQDVMGSRAGVEAGAPAG